MEKSKGLPGTKQLQRWWRNWGWFDVIVLGLGVGLSGGYVLYKVQSDEAKSAALEIWVGIAVGILGAWITVRIFEAFVRATEKRERARQYVIYSLNYISAESGRLRLGGFYDFNILGLDTELKWARERFKESRKRHLEPDEQRYVEDAYDKLELTINLAREYLQAEKAIRKRRYKIDDLLDAMNEAADEFESQLRALNEQPKADPAAVTLLETRTRRTQSHACPFPE